MALQRYRLYRKDKKLMAGYARHWQAVGVWKGETHLNGEGVELGKKLMDVQPSFMAICL